MADQFSEPSKSSVPAQIKKPYVAPVLQKWGKMSDLTRSTGQYGNSDGARFGRNTRTA